MTPHHPLPTPNMPTTPTVLVTKLRRMRIENVTRTRRRASPTVLVTELRPLRIGNGTRTFGGRG
jgi:hypothetical protein